MNDREKSAYRHGWDCGKNGPSPVNCHFSLFGTKQTMQAWECGKRDGERGTSPKVKGASDED